MTCGGQSSFREFLPKGTILPKMNSEKYIKMLEEKLLLIGHNLGGENWTFQQDNAPIHVSKKSKSWFEEKGIRRFEHSPLSPDLNPI